MKNIAIIQARMTSSRLPGKATLKLAGKTVTEHVVERVKQSKLVDEVFVATPMDSEELPLINLLSGKNIRVFCGSTNDVLDRFYQLAKVIKPENVVRITGDCPAIDPEIIDQVIEKHLKTGADYTSNTIIETFPDGLDVEVFKFSVLKEAWQNASLQSEREHVTLYIRNNKNKYKMENLSSPTNLSNKRWTIDEQRDYEFLLNIFENIYPTNQNFRMKDVLEYLKKNSDVEKINSNIVRNEGLIKSLKKDKKVIQEGK